MDRGTRDTGCCQKRPFDLLSFVVGFKELQRQGSAEIVIGLAGNKMDLESKREVQTEVC